MPRSRKVPLLEQAIEFVLSAPLAEVTAFMGTLGVLVRRRTPPVKVKATKPTPTEVPLAARTITEPPVPTAATPSPAARRRVRRRRASSQEFSSLDAVRQADAEAAADVPPVDPEADAIDESIVDTE